MNQLRLNGIELRYVLTMHLAQHGPATIAELIPALNHHGFTVRGRPSKTISDALRWEMEHGRVHRFERGRYGPAHASPTRCSHGLSFGGGHNACRLLAATRVADVT